MREIIGNISLMGRFFSSLLENPNKNFGLFLLCIKEFGAKMGAVG